MLQSLSFGVRTPLAPAWRRRYSGVHTLQQRRPGCQLPCRLPPTPSDALLQTRVSSAAAPLFSDSVFSIPRPQTVVSAQSRVHAATRTSSRSSVCLGHTCVFSCNPKSRCLLDFSPASGELAFSSSLRPSKPSFLTVSEFDVQGRGDGPCLSPEERAVHARAGSFARALSLPFFHPSVPTSASQNRRRFATSSQEAREAKRTNGAEGGMRGVNVIEEPNEGRPAPLGEKHTEEKSEARGFGAGTASASVLSQQATPPGGNFWQTHEQTEKTETEEGGESTVYRQPEGMVQHVFQWGIGNAFRAISVNRYRPVHAARPKEVSIHPSYFVSPHPCVIWEPLNEAWEVYFYENRKKSAKPFPVKKFGIARAKREALDFLKQMEEEGRLEKPTFASGVEGVTFDQVTGSWICRYIDADGRSMSRGFSADFHGFEEAKNLAEERKAATMENLRNDFLGANMRLVKDKQTS